MPIDVLLIEDEPPHATLVQRAFERQAGEMVLTVTGSLQAARAYLAHTTPNLVISDWKLPDGEGIDILRQYKDAGFPIVVMTSHGNEKLAVEVMKAGAFDYIVKSNDTLVDMAHLAERVLREWGHLVERRQAEEALHESEELNRRLIETVPGGIVRVSAEGAVMFANTEAQRILGLSYDELCQRYVESFETQTIWEDGSPCPVESYPVTKCLRTGTSQSPTTMGIKRPDGSICWAIFNAVPYVNPKTLEPGGAVVTFLDITAQQEANEALHESEARNAAILEASQDCIITIDEEARIIDFNPAAEATFGHAAADVLGQSITTLIIPPRLQEAHRMGMARYKRTGKSKMMNKRVRLTAVRANGVEFPIEMVVQPIEMNRRSLFTAYLRDITERVAFEKALLEAKDNAEETSRLKSSFLNNISHEIRTPLTAIIGFSSILQSEVDEEHCEMVELIEHSGKRLLSTLNTVLDLSMLEAGTLNMESEWVHLQSIIQEKISAFEPIARDKQVDVILENAVGDAEGYLDRTCMGRVLDHLLDNAIKFTEKGSICVALKTDDETLVLSIADTGVGIDRSFQPHLYEEFKQESAGTTRSYEGTGLGLTITKCMVDLMGGTIMVQSQKGKGSTFALRFPLSLVRMPSDQLASSPNIPSLERQKRRILAVEDSMEIEVLLSYILQENYYVDVVKNEEAVLEKVKDTSYDLVLMDINLGTRRTGIDVMHSLRKMPAYASVPIIAMTAYALLEDRERFLEVGFDGYISKPFTTKELLDIIEQMLETGIRKRLPTFPINSERA